MRVRSQWGAEHDRVWQELLAWKNRVLDGADEPAPAHLFAKLLALRKS